MATVRHCCQAESNTGLSLAWPHLWQAGLIVYSNRLSDKPSRASSHRHMISRVHNNGPAFYSPSTIRRASLVLTSKGAAHCAAIHLPLRITSRETGFASTKSLQGITYPCGHTPLQVLLTLFPECFSPFDHSTCALSVQ